MTIKQKLLLIAGLIAVAMLLAIFNTRWTVSTLNELTAAQGINHQLLADMLTLRRHEKDFLMRNDLKYKQKFEQTFSQMMNNVKQLDDLLKENDIQIDEYASLEAILKNYRSHFFEVVTLLEQMGLDHNSGLRGTLRASVHKAEDFFKKVSNDTLLKDMLTLRRNEKDFIIRSLPKYLDKFNNNYRIFIDDINHSNIGTAHKTRLLADVEVYKNDFLKLAALSEKKGLTPSTGTLGKMRTTIHQSEAVIEKNHKIIDQAIISNNDSIQTVNLIVSLCIAIIVIGLTWLLSQSIGRSLSSFVTTLNHIVSTGNLTLRVDENSNDEIAEVGHTLNMMLGEFQSIVQRLHHASSDLTKYATQFMHIRENTFSSVEKQQMETEQVSTAMTQMTTTARGIAQNTTQTADAAERTNQMTNEGKTVVDQTASSITRLEQVINNANTVIQKLGEDSNSIGGILDVIRGIAEQTNLLALNAAIEAARAGEQGRGFAVVADEVRTLAQKTQDSISEIESMITSLQTGSVQAIDAIAQGKSGVSTNVEHINKAGETLNQIVGQLNMINQMSQENALATEEQSKVAEDVNKNVMAIKDIGSNIMDNIEQLKDSSNKIGLLTVGMDELVKRFKI